MEISIDPILVLEDIALLTAHSGQGFVVPVPVVDSYYEGVTFTTPTPPTLGEVSFDMPPPTMTYTPDEHAVGDDTFTLVASNPSVSTDPITVSVHIAGVAAFDQFAVVNEDDATSVVLAADQDSVDPLTFTVESQPSMGALSGDAPDLVYTPQPDATGKDTFTFSATDGAATSGEATVTVTIRPVNDPPSMGSIEDVVVDPDGEPYEVALTGVSPGPEDEDDQTVSITTHTSDGALVPPPAVSGSGATRALVLTPAPGASGEATITVTLTDDGESDAPHENSTTLEFLVTLTPPEPVVMTVTVRPESVAAMGDEVRVMAEIEGATGASFVIDGMAEMEPIAMAFVEESDGGASSYYEGVYLVEDDYVNVTDAAVTVTASNAGPVMGEMTVEAAVTIDAVAEFGSLRSDPVEMSRGEPSILIAEAETGATVAVDLSPVDPTLADPVVLAESPDEPGRFLGSVTLDMTTAVSGLTSVDVTVTDAVGNVSVAPVFLRVEPLVTFTMDLHGGINLVHVPVEVAGMSRASDLMRLLGGSEDVALIVAQNASGEFIAFTPAMAPGSPVDVPLPSYAAAMVLMRRAKSVTVTGTPLDEGVELRPGVNLIGIPRRGAARLVGDIVALAPSAQRVIHEVDGRFVSVVSAATDAPVVGGRGILVVSRGVSILRIPGEPWDQ
jgi:hypothetical protein